MSKQKKIVSIANQKGGVGKTTTSINTAAYLAKFGYRVLLVDMDPQGNSTSGLAIDKQKISSSMYDVLVDSVPINQAIVKSRIKNLDILPSNTSLAAAEVEMTDINGRELILKKALESADYDVLMIDCPPSLGLLTLNSFVASDYVLIPVQSEYYALEGLSELLSTIKRVRVGLNTNLELLGVVVTMHNRRTSLGEQVLSELRRHFPAKLFDTVVPRNIRLAEAPSHGKPIYEYDRFSKGAAAYKKLAKEIEKRLQV